MPSMRTSPDFGSYSRVSRLAMVLLPAPVWPTMPSVLPAGTVNEMSSSTCRFST